MRNFTKLSLILYKLIYVEFHIYIYEFIYEKNCVCYDVSGKCHNNNVRIDNTDKLLLRKEKQECG
jgi:hypothetical protein